MEAFFIFNDSSLKEDKLLSVLSAFAVVDMTGNAADLLQAVDIIRQRHPDAFIFDTSILDGGGAELITSRLDGKAPLVILPRNYKIRDACTYVSVSFEFTELCDYTWLMRSIGGIIRQYHGQDAR